MYDILPPAQTSSCSKPKAGKSFAVADAVDADDADDADDAAQAGDADGGNGHHLLGVDG